MVVSIESFVHKSHRTLITPHQLLTLHLVLQRTLGPRGDWAPYMQMLPEVFDTMPVMYERELVGLLPEFMRGSRSFLGFALHDILGFDASLTCASLMDPRSLEEVETQRERLRADFDAVDRFLKVDYRMACWNRGKCRRT